MAFQLEGILQQCQEGTFQFPSELTTRSWFLEWLFVPNNKETSIFSVRTQTSMGKILHAFRVQYNRSRSWFLLAPYYNWWREQQQNTSGCPFSNETSKIKICEWFQGSSMSMTTRIETVYQVCSLVFVLLLCRCSIEKCIDCKKMQGIFKGRYQISIESPCSLYTYWKCTQKTRT